MIYAFMLCEREMWCERFVDDIKIEPSARIFPEKAGVQPVNAFEGSVSTMSMENAMSNITLSFTPKATDSVLSNNS